MKPEEMQTRLRELLDANLDDAGLRRELEQLARDVTFGGFTRLWGPALYQRNRVMFRPFILSHFSRTLITDNWKSRNVEWSKEIDDWLAKADECDDVQLFRRLCAWKHTPANTWQINSPAWCAELRDRFKAAASPALRQTVLSKYDVWFKLDESTAVELYQTDPQAAKPFILRHAQTFTWRGQDRDLWAELADCADRNGDEEFQYALFRKQAPLSDWESLALNLCQLYTDPAELTARLEAIHPEGYGLDLGNGVFGIVEARGRDALPYVFKHLSTVWSYHGRGAYERLLDLAITKEWWDLWAGLVRVNGREKEYNNEVRHLLRNNLLNRDEKQRRLRMLAGVSREINFPGFGLARLQLLDDEVAVELYEQFPEMVRGPFKLHVSPTWRHVYKNLTERVVEAGDEVLTDFLASRLVTRGGGYWGDKDQLAAAERFADYYESLKVDEETFSRRAAAVLTQVPAFAIWNYNNLIRTNRLARLLFERSASAYLASPPSVADLVEGSEIHVQALAYRILGLNDDRARQLAAEHVELLLGAFLRPLHRKTRLLAFGALINAASTPAPAERIHQRAREALELPDIRYPKEQLIGLIGRLLAAHPQLRSAGEEPVVYEYEAAQA